MIYALRSLLFGALVVIGAGAASSFRHNHLIKSAPGNGQQLSVAPKEIRLWFNERPEIPFTSVTLMESDSTKIATIKAVATSDSMVAAVPLSHSLPAGKYLVAWRTASSDGHAIRGVFGFSILP